MPRLSGEWRRRRQFVGYVASWILVIVGLIFVVAGLTYCRATIEGTAEEFRYNFVPLFVLVTLGLVLMLTGSIGLMHLEISAHEYQVLKAIEELEKQQRVKAPPPPRTGEGK